MDSFDLVKTFHEVATLGSFSQAAAKLNVSKATVSKYVSELETRFGVRLLNRSTRSVTMTDAGLLFFERSAPVVDMIQSMRDELRERAERPSGRICVSAPIGVGHGSIPRLLGQFMGYYPEISVTLQLNHRPIDMAEEAVDLWLRLGPILDENLIVRKLRQVPLVLCATSEYWRKHGMPNHPSELGKYVALVRSEDGLHPHWGFSVNGRITPFPVKARMECTDGAPLVQIALGGYGMVYLPELLVQSHIDSGELVVALDEYARKDMWLTASYLAQRHNSAALRALLDFLVSRIKAWQPHSAG